MVYEAGSELSPAVLLTYGRYAVIGAHGRILTTPPLVGPPPGRFDAFWPLLEDQFIIPLTVLMRGEALVATGGFKQLPGHGHIDYVTFLDLAERGEFFATDQVIAEWRRHATSETSRAKDIPGYFRGPLLCRHHAIAALARRVPPGSPRHARARRRIARSWNRALTRRYWHAGRVLNAERRWADASTMFRRGLRVSDSTLLQKAELIVGLTASVLRIDLESLIAWVRGGAAFSDLRA